MVAKAIPYVTDMDLSISLKDAAEIDLRARLQEIASSASELTVTDEPSFQRVTYLYAEAKSWEKQIEHARKEANEPDQKRINARNDKAKELLTPLKEIQQIAKDKSADYQALLEARKAKELENIEKAVDILGLDDMPYMPPMQKAIRGHGAVMYTKTVTKFRLVSFANVPLKYLQLNEDLIERDIKLGIGEIPGLEIYEEKQTQLKTR